MSFILDALRKSENERQRNTTPGIASAPVKKPTSRRSLWIPLVAVLLGINLSLLAVLWYTGDEADNVAAVDAPAAMQANTSPPPVIRAPAPAEMPTDLPIADPAISRELTAELEQPATASPASGAAAEMPVELPAAAPASANAADMPVIDVPTLAELVLDGTVSLPPLHLDIHVYSNTPAERFVFINTAKYREGERISEGPVIDEINQLGVVLKHQNRRFLLTRE